MKSQIERCDPEGMTVLDLKAPVVLEHEAADDQEHAAENNSLPEPAVPTYDILEFVLAQKQARQSPPDSPAHSE